MQFIMQKEIINNSLLLSINDFKPKRHFQYTNNGSNIS